MNSCCCSFDQRRLGIPRIEQEVTLQQDVSSIVQAHDQRSHPSHVIHIREGDQRDGGHVMQEHQRKSCRKSHVSVNIVTSCNLRDKHSCHAVHFLPSSYVNTRINIQSYHIGTFY